MQTPVFVRQTTPSTGIGRQPSTGIIRMQTPLSVRQQNTGSSSSSRRTDANPRWAKSNNSLLGTLLVLGLALTVVDLLFVLNYVSSRELATVPTTLPVTELPVAPMQSKSHIPLEAANERETGNETQPQSGEQPKVMAPAGEARDAAPVRKSAGEALASANGEARIDGTAKKTLASQTLNTTEAAGIPIVPSPSAIENGGADGTASNSSLRAGKQYIIDLLAEAGYTDMDPALVEKLPDWSDVTALYGDRPVIYGLENCKAFQNRGDPAEHIIGTAGTFNSGTNLMSELLINNCYMPARMLKYGTPGVRWQVIWGKHNPVFDENYRQHHRTPGYQNDNLKTDDDFPVVMVRDPYKWMQSMCRHPYEASWELDQNHCPNLVRNANDQRGLAGKAAVPVEARYGDFIRSHDSLVGLWNDWYNEYVQAPFPRIFVRFEDLIFFPKEVTKKVCECAGGRLVHPPFHYIVESAKLGFNHGADRTGYIEALIKYGTKKNRYDGFEEADLEYANHHLDPNLMKIFGYPYHP